MVQNRMVRSEFHQGPDALAAPMGWGARLDFVSGCVATGLHRDALRLPAKADFFHRGGLPFDADAFDALGSAVVQRLARARIDGRQLGVRQAGVRAGQQEEERSQALAHGLIVGGR
jgi:hypothetical protein